MVNGAVELFLRGGPRGEGGRTIRAVGLLGEALPEGGREGGEQTTRESRLPSPLHRLPHRQLAVSDQTQESGIIELHQSSQSTARD